MSVHCFTSATFSYLAKARVLGTSLKKFHPDWNLTLCVTDREPPGFHLDLAIEPFDDVIWGHELPIDCLMGWLFKHEVVEACTAVKGLVLKLLLDAGAEKVFYLDPDIAVFAPLSPLATMLDENSILLTPHQICPERGDSAIRDNEISSLLHGTYNLGFVGVKNDKTGRAFAEWWSDRLSEYCIDDKASGVFVDQKWCDLVPAYFEDVLVVRDPGYNVASWNLSNRKIHFEYDGSCFVNGHTLRFYHFTKLGPIGDAMTRKYARGNFEVYELWSWYKREVGRFSDVSVPAGWWHYGQFDNGATIPRSARLRYRQSKHLIDKFPNPFSHSESSYYAWLQANGHL